MTCMLSGHHCTDGGPVSLLFVSNAQGEVEGPRRVPFQLKYLSRVCYRDKVVAGRNERGISPDVRSLICLTCKSVIFY